jgi:hypothetical protein
VDRTLKSLRIGCGAGFWGDSPAGAAQLVHVGDIDVLVLDYLAEITMALLARQRQKDPKLGYAPDFLTQVMAPLARSIAAKRIRIVTNAGGVNPTACRDALRALLDLQGLPLKIGTVTGDDVRVQVGQQQAAEQAAGRPSLPAQTISANAYLGAFPIAAALRRGADIVITGRCVDSALALGPLIAHFDWQPQDLDQLAMGSLAGHIIECGTQGTGGIYTDWREVADGWANMGYPIVECAADGSFTVSKPAGTGGLVSAPTVAEQVTYEIHDPGRYVLPDVTCDFTDVQLTDLSDQRVAVKGARGLAPPPDYKTTITHADGYRSVTTLLIVGPEAAAKARRQAEAILERVRRLMQAGGFADFRETSLEVLGAESLYGPAARTTASREVVLKIGVAHDQRAALEVFAHEVVPSATAMSQGTSGFAAGRPGIQPVVRLMSALLPQEEVPVQVEVDGRSERWSRTTATGRVSPTLPASRYAAFAPAAGDMRTVPLLALAHGRSGDKGDTSNISVLARRREFLPCIAAALTPAAVQGYFAHLVRGPVLRYDWPGLLGFNFVLEEALGGGGAASLRYDPQGKAYAQMLMDFPVPVPAAWLGPKGLLASASQHAVPA